MIIVVMIIFLVICQILFAFLCVLANQIAVKIEF